MKKCNECGLNKSLDSFYSHPWTSDKKMKMCDECHSIRTKQAPRDIGTPEERRVRTSRNSQLKMDYGINIDVYEEMVKSQGGVCWICKGVNTDGRGLSVDYDHRTGKVRGCLCSKCNRALGGFDDSSELLAKAIDYLVYFS